MSSEVRERGLVLAVQVLVSLIIGFIPEWIGSSWDTFQQAMLALGVFIVFLTVDVLLILLTIERIRLGEWAAWHIRDKADTELSNIRAAFAKVVADGYGERDLFVTHLMGELRDVEKNTRDVADKRELRVQADHFLSVDNVLDAFAGDSDRTWRYTWHITDAQLFDDLAWRRYFEGTARMAHDGQLHEIKAILMVDDLQVLTLPRVAKLLDFFKTNDRLSCRVIKMSVYSQACEGSGAQDCIDFGIYGTRYLFLTKQYEPNIEGTFSKDAMRISNYCSLFESMWTSASMTTTNPSTATAELTLEQLLAFDETPS